MVFQNSKDFPTHPKCEHLSPERIAHLFYVYSVEIESTNSKSEKPFGSLFCFQAVKSVENPPVNLYVLALLTSIWYIISGCIGVLDRVYTLLLSVAVCKVVASKPKKGE